MCRHLPLRVQLFDLLIHVSDVWFIDKWKIWLILLLYFLKFEMNLVRKFRYYFFVYLAAVLSSCDWLYGLIIYRPSVLYLSYFVNVIQRIKSRLNPYVSFGNEVVSYSIPRCHLDLTIRFLLLHIWSKEESEDLLPLHSSLWKNTPHFLEYYQSLATTLRLDTWLQQLKELHCCRFVASLALWCISASSLTGGKNRQRSKV
jgi:hypothetical protein